MSTNTNQEILREFLLETHENLALLDSDLVTLEKNPTEKNTLAQVFRTLHSVKGTAGFMGLVKLQAVAHSAESLLSKLRAGEIIFNPTIATAMLKVVDAIREMLASIETSGSEGAGDYTALQAEVDRLRETGGGIAPAAPPLPLPPAVEQPPIVTPVVAALPTPPPPVPEQVPRIAVPAAVASAPEPAATESVEPRVPVNVADTNIRVDVGLLDKLMTLVGELVLARNQILQYSTSHEDDAFLGAVQRLNLLTTELQASVMKTRMQPIGNVLNKFPRVVRDLALACGKKVRFEMDGQETELDKTLIEAIRDPLTHMVRNAIDHGIEAPAVRKSRGKSEEGRLRMDAFHEGGKVIIEIADDGGGIDVARVRDKAIQAKLITPESAARMSRQELLRLIFLPGFSTADRVTQFSGRGVGMDVVRTNIEKIGGTVDIESTEGQGTKIRTKIPLTLAIIPALIIVSGGERYAIPQVSLLELVRLDPEQAEKGIERIHGAPVYRLRGALLPLVFLDEQLKLDVTRNPGQDLNIVVLQADDRPFGLVVDTIRDTEEIVVKPLQKQLKGISVFAGAAIMGDGRVALVLDVLGLAQRANVLTGAKGKSLSEREQTVTQASSGAESLLFFEPREGGQMAIPLSLVARLEEIPQKSLEKLGDRQVVQYRGEILPLVDVSRELEALRLGAQPSGENSVTFATTSKETIPVVVCAGVNQRVGLMVGKILDIVHDQISARSRANRPGVLFTAIVQDRVTEFVDVVALVREATTDLPQPKT
jgi:two-component system chemotaxis sensor kinase CheA